MLDESHFYQSIEVQVESMLIDVAPKVLSRGSFAGVLSSNCVDKKGVYWVRDKNEFSINSLRCASGVIVADASPSSHLAIICRNSCVPALSVCQKDHKKLEQYLGCRVYYSDHDEGLFVGEAVNRCDTPNEYASQINQTLNEVDLTFKVNADTASDLYPISELNFGGVGIFRLEHSLQHNDIRDDVANLIRGNTTRGEKQRVLDHLLSDVYSMLDVLNGRKLTLRAIDPPRHELSTHGVRFEEETNPMMGVRGARLILESANVAELHIDLLREIKNENVELLIPFVVNNSELEMIVRRLDVPAYSLPLGVMVETPSCCFEEFEPSMVSFLSYGTNDLTQFVYAISRDDYNPGYFPNVYFDGPVLHSPFNVLAASVKKMIAICNRNNPGLRKSICGEHASEVDTIIFALENDINELSLSPSMLGPTIAKISKLDLHDSSS